VATLLSLALAVVVVRVGLIYSLGPRAFAAASFAPNHPRVLASEIDGELGSNKGVVTDRARTAARKLARRAPLRDNPMLIGGIDALVAKDPWKAKQFLSHALARNPRSEFARLLMLELDLRTSDVKHAVIDMTILGRLLPDVQTVFVPELARMARDPRTSRALAPTLRSDPVMLASVLQHLARNGADPRLVLELAGGVSPPPNDVADWREPLLRAMVDRGDAVQARRLWGAFAGMEQTGSGAAIYDNGFRGLPGLPPFNWALKASEIGVAERDRDGGLQIEYYGRQPGELAEQLVALPPGRYRLGFRAEGDINDPQHRLFWRIACVWSEKAALIELPIADLTFAGRTIAGDFTVPAGCSAQWLRLVGEPTEFPKVESVMIRQIRIVPLTVQS